MSLDSLRLHPCSGSGGRAGEIRKDSVCVWIQGLISDSGGWETAKATAAAGSRNGKVK